MIYNRFYRNRKTENRNRISKHSINESQTQYGLVLKDFDERCVENLINDIEEEITKTKNKINIEERKNEFSRKVDRLYDHLEGLESLSECLSNFLYILSKADTVDDETEINEFVSSLEWCYKNGSGYSVEEILDTICL